PRPRGVARFSSPPTLAPKVTGDLVLPRVASDPDGVLHRPCIRTSMRHPRHPVDAEERRAAELPPVDPLADLTHAGSDQQPAQHAGQRLRNLVAKSPKQKLCGGLRHLDRDVADEAIPHHALTTCAVNALWFD